MDTSPAWRLACTHCGAVHGEREDAFLLACPAGHEPALLRTVYPDRQLVVDAERPGVFRYASWLPVRGAPAGAGSPVVFHAGRLGDRLGLERLFVAFSGYWPERGCLLETCSFKELEALAVCARMPPGARGSRLVVASAGNTGRAFLQVGTRAGMPVLVVVPETALGDLWTTIDRHPDAKLVALRAPADYADAIALADRIAALEGFIPEGGARNVARRDGMGTVMLTAAEALGALPAHYVQAVGSGTGAIAAWEAGIRLLADGRFGSSPPKLHLVQNEPFTPMHLAWQLHSRDLPRMDDGDARRRIERLHSRVLSNRRPPWAVRGGVFDALDDTGGFTYAVANEAAREAGRLFEKLEGRDLDPAAEVALAGLGRAVEAGRIGRLETVLLNATGGGAAALRAEARQKPGHPDLLLDTDGIDAMALERELTALGRPGR